MKKLPGELTNEKNRRQNKNKNKLKNTTTAAAADTATLDLSQMTEGTAVILKMRDTFLSKVTYNTQDKTFKESFFLLENTFWVVTGIPTTS